jgi:hypothetical protein
MMGFLIFVSLTKHNKMDTPKVLKQIQMNIFYFLFSFHWFT